MLNIFVPVQFFVLLSMLSFVYPTHEPENRLEGGLSLVLTSAAFKIFVGNMVPKLSYRQVKKKKNP